MNRMSISVSGPGEKSIRNYEDDSVAAADMVIDL
jgi:hypothetical protein